MGEEKFWGVTMPCARQSICQQRRSPSLNLSSVISTTTTAVALRSFRYPKIRGSELVTCAVVSRVWVVRNASIPNSETRHNHLNGFCYHGLSPGLLEICSEFLKLHLLIPNGVSLQSNKGADRWAPIVVLKREEGFPLFHNQFRCSSPI